MSTEPTSPEDETRAGERSPSEPTGSTSAVPAADPTQGSNANVGTSNAGADGAQPSQHPQTGPTAAFASAQQPWAQPSHESPDAVPQPQRRTPIFGTIFWGVILLVFAVVMVVLAIPTIQVDVVALTITALVALGALLVAAGIAASIRNRQR
ncbi:hypothetical protein [Microbacterium sp. MPKO10]|uniref:hypothetical protein n=1 Tax=Microbacterium sp. MPKO10 TaxID=2989818 RepID=UPI00223551F7|nr:hypothetical protein [Microbacterium sp. MPKO10]MCW4459063.1 hypothetical protein [Microbacterium sp. MPKO10]